MSGRARRAAALAVALLLAWPPGARACTTFLLERGAARVVGKSYDWHMGQGLVLVNRRGVAKQALPIKAGETPARWISRHASVTFNQYGRELPNGGMNDAGLVVEIMWLDSGQYEPPDARPTVSELQWIQFQLDSFATVAEMTAAAARVRISPAYAKVHYLACDRGGACAAFEPVGGKLVVTPGARVLTNHTYAEATAHAAGLAQAPRGPGSLARFARVARQAADAGAGKDGRGRDAVAAAFQVLDGVRGAESQWNIVYDPVRLRVHFRTLASGRVKWLDLAKLDGPCASAVPLLDIDADAQGDVTGLFRPYAADTNRRLVERSLRDIQKRLPPGAVELVAGYPTALACAAP